MSRKRAQMLAIRWILDSARGKKGRPIARCLADELIAAYNGEGGAMTTRENVHKMAEANKAVLPLRLVGEPNLTGHGPGFDPAGLIWGGMNRTGARIAMLVAAVLLYLIVDAALDARRGRDAFVPLRPGPTFRPGDPTVVEEPDEAPAARDRPAPAPDPARQALVRAALADGGMATVVAFEAFVADPWNIRWYRDAASLPAGAVLGADAPVAGADAWLRGLPRRPELALLDLGRCDVSDDGLRTAARHGGLRALVLTGSTGFTSRGLDSLASLADLEMLFLAGTAVDDRAMPVLAGLPKLRVLVLGGGVTDKGVAHLARAHTLEFLAIGGTSVTARSIPRVRRAAATEGARGRAHGLDRRGGAGAGRRAARLPFLDEAHRLPLSGRMRSITRRDARPEA